MVIGLVPMYSRFWLMVKNSEVEKFVSECGNGNYKRYLVCWVGYSAEHTLWLPKSKLTQAPDVLAAWKW